MKCSQRTKKICFFSGDITRCGGTERIAIMLANELIRDPETEITFLSWSERSAEPFFPIDPRIRRHKLFPFNIPFRFFYGLAAKILKSFLIKNNFTHLIDIDAILTNVSAQAVAQTSCKLISWEHFHYHENLGCKLRDRGRRLAKKYANIIVTLTENDRQQYMETTSSAQIVTIPNAIISPEENSSVLLPEKPFILSVGRLCYQKGFDQIPAIAEKVFAQHNNWKWVIVGDGPDYKKLKSEIAKRGLSEKIILAGRQATTSYYLTAAFTVMPSRFEGFPLVLLESLYLHCPVISFDCKNGPAEVIRDGENGFLVPPGDTKTLTEKIRVLMDDDSLRERFSRSARESICTFSPENFFARWRKLLADPESRS